MDHRCYKLFTLVRWYDHHYSLFSYHATSAWNIYYLPGVKAVPKIGKLFVFRDVMDARQQQTDGKVLFECQFEGDLQPLLFGTQRSNAWRLFWTHPHGKRDHSEYPLPQGTSVVDAVTPLRPVNAEWYPSMDLNYQKLIVKIWSHPDTKFLSEEEAETWRNGEMRRYG